MIKLYPQVDLASVKEEFLPTEPSIHVDDAESSHGGESQTKP